MGEQESETGRVGLLFMFGQLPRGSIVLAGPDQSSRSTSLARRRESYCVFNRCSWAFGAWYRYRYRYRCTRTSGLWSQCSTRHDGRHDVDEAAYRALLGWARTWRLWKRIQWSQTTDMGWSTADVPQAIAVLKGDSKVNGVITFEQAQEGAPVTVTGDVSLPVYSSIDPCQAVNMMIEQWREGTSRGAGYEGRKAMEGG